MCMNFNDAVEIIQNEVSYCDYCQPYDGGESVWIFGYKRCLDELFDDYNIPEKWRENIASKLVCPFCGSDVFSRYSDYGEKTSIELEADERWNQWYAKYASNLSDFAHYLESFPYLGLSHPIGIQIQKAIQSFPTVQIKNKTWYRARKPDGSKLFTCENMMPPTAKNAKSEGRFSHYGQSVLYLASDEQAVLSEILNRKKNEGIAWIQDFIIYDSGEILDLRLNPDNAEDLDIPVLALGLIHDHLPNSKPDSDSAWKPEYFVPRFISDCAKKAGFNGIIFQSDKHYYDNLVLFGWDKSIVKSVGKTRLVHLNTELSPIQQACEDSLFIDIKI